MLLWITNAVKPVFNRVFLDIICADIKYSRGYPRCCTYKNITLFIARQTPPK